DYVTKPFSVRELVARVRALLRRQAWNEADSTHSEQRIHIGPLIIDVARHRVSREGEDIDLTPREFELLVHFARHRGQTFSRAQLLDAVWGYSYAGYEHTVNTHINRLRAKIEQDPTRPCYVQTVWGVGYRFVDSDPGPG
ncbi:MAG: response regulator transcription factor, partial [Caldilineaceae bacterium]|nr:response regulator transcription factor [Caldilineaceae bacterium]